MQKVPKFQQEVSSEMPSWAKDVTTEQVLCALGIFTSLERGYRRACGNVVTFINKAREICPDAGQANALVRSGKITQSLADKWVSTLMFIAGHEETMATVGVPDWMIPIDVMGRKARLVNKRKSTEAKPAKRVYQRDLRLKIGRQRVTLKETE